MSTRDEKLARLEDVTELVSEAVYEAIAEQSKIVAANLLVQIGDKGLLTGTGFVLACEAIHEAALAWLLAEGYVELTDKARAPEDEVSERRRKRTERAAEKAARKAQGRETRRLGAESVGHYL